MSQTPPTDIVFDEFDELQAYACCKGPQQRAIVAQLLEGPIPVKEVPNGYVRISYVVVIGKYGASMQSWSPLRKRLRAEGFRFSKEWDPKKHEGTITMWVDKSSLVG